MDVRGRPLPWQDDDPAYWLPKETPPEDRGTPLLGRITLGGKAETNEDWQEEWGRRLPRASARAMIFTLWNVKARGNPSSFATFHLGNFGKEKRPSIAGMTGKRAGWFGRLSLLPSKAVIVTLDGQRHELDLGNIMRIGKIIGRWSSSKGRSDQG